MNWRSTCKALYDALDHLSNDNWNTDKLISRVLEGNYIHVGEDFQAKIPAYQELADRSCIGDDSSLCIWKPPDDRVLSDDDIYEYTAQAVAKYGYNLEQAYGLLQYNSYDIEKSKRDLQNYRPIGDDWTQADAILFEQAFNFNGKCFHRIQQGLPDKTIPSLVKYYYSWKKRERLRTTYLEHCNKRTLDSDDDSDSNGYPNKRFVFQKKQFCTNCKVPTVQLVTCSKGKLCKRCYQDYSVPKKFDSGVGDVEKESKRNHKIPKGIHLSVADFNALVCRSTPTKVVVAAETSASNSSTDADYSSPATSSSSSSTLITNGEMAGKSKVDCEIIGCRIEAQKNRQTLTQLRCGAGDAIAAYRLPPKPKLKKTSNSWSEHEVLLAKQGFKTFGKDFSSIADIMVTKTSDQIKSWFLSRRKEYNLDELIKEFEEQKLHVKKAEDNAVVIQLSDDEDESQTEK